MENKTEVVRLRITPELKCKLQEAAAAENRTMSNYIENLIKKSFTKEENKMKETITLYAATKKVWGADHPRYFYFETIQERNAFVKNTDYADKAGTVKLTPTQYAEWKKFGYWNQYE